MCMFCAAIPAAAAVGVKLDADQKRKTAARRWPITKLTTLVVSLLLLASIVYHSLVYRN